MQQLVRDVDDEMQWLAEKEPQAASHDLGTSLTAVQSLQKKHQVNKIMNQYDKTGTFLIKISMYLLFLCFLHYLISLQALEAEILSHEPVVLSLTKRAQQMVQSNHFAAQRIEKISNELQEKLVTVKDLASVRRLRLLDAVESQMVKTLNYFQKILCQV